MPAHMTRPFIPLFVAFIIASGLTASCQWFTSTEYVEISNDSLRVVDEWTTLTPVEPFSSSLRCQSILLEPMIPRSVDIEGLSLRLSDGRRVVPDVELIAVDGSIHRLSNRSMLGSTYYKADMLGYSGDGLAAGGTFRSVRIRSDLPVTLRRVVWMCWNPK